MNRPLGTFALVAGFASAAVCAGAIFGCMRGDQSTWVVRSAPTPEGWPEPTPVGEVHIRQYPAYRAAVARTPAESERLNEAATRSRREPSSSLFMTLFRHIDSKDIPMTAPVEMEYATEERSKPRLEMMAFLYQSSDVGSTGLVDGVEVVDVPPQTFASLGLRGDYTQGRFESGLERVLEWIDENAEAWEIAGRPRYLGYNGPFTPSALKYGEVQVPVRARSKSPSDAER